MASAKQIPPGGEGTIDVDIKTQGRSGTLQKIITVLTNDPVNPQTKLTVKTQVEIAFSLSQPGLNIGQVKAGQTATYYLSLVGADKDKYKITAITPTHKFIDVELNQAGFENDPDKKLKITFHDDIPVGRIHHRVTLATDYPLVPELSFQVNIEIIGDILVEPTFLSFGVFDPAVENVRQVRLSAADPTTFKIINVVSPMEGLVAEVNSLTEGKLYEVKLTARSGFPFPAIRGTLVVETDNQRQPEILIKVTGRPMAETKPNPD